MSNIMNNIKWLYPVFGIAMLATSCQGPAGGPPMLGPVPVNLDTVELQKAVFFDQYPANVVAMNEVELRSEVNGFITDIYFEEGHFVRKGQKLYAIEQSKYAAAYSQANASYKIAQANLEKAQNDAGRYSRLGDQGMATKQRVEYAETDVENAKMQVEAAQATLQRASIDLKHATITAPFDGTIGISLVKKGAYVSAGQTLLNTVSSDNPMAVDFVISEKEITRFFSTETTKTIYKRLFVHFCLGRQIVIRLSWTSRILRSCRRSSNSYFESTSSFSESEAIPKSWNEWKH